MDEQKQKLIQAINDNDLKTIKKVLKKNRDLVKETKSPYLYLALLNEQEKVLELLVEFGSDVNELNYLGHPPLFEAAAKKGLYWIKWLMKHGAVIDKSSKDTNPLFSAIRDDNIEAIKYFLEKGLDPNIKYPSDLSGETAIDCARYYDKHEIVSLLGGETKKRPIWVNVELPDYTGRKPDEEIITQIEIVLNTKFPGFYKEFLIKNFPHELFFENTQDNDSWIWLSEDYALFHTARSFIAYNCKNPKAKQKEIISDKYLVIGTNGGGDNWCISKDETDTNIYKFLHEEERYVNQGITLQTHIQSLIENL